jgi:hypothetical protein
MTLKPLRLLTRRPLNGRSREAALEVVLGWTGRTRQPLPVSKGRKP